MSTDMCLPVSGKGSSRRGITPVVSIVLLLMMTVAAAGAAYSWFNDVQDDVQKQAESKLQTAVEVRGIQCVKDPSGDQLVIELKNTGARDILGTSVDLYIYDNNGDIHAAITNQDWSTSAGWIIASPSGSGFLQSGGYGRLAVDMPAGSQFVTERFYTTDISFTDSEISKKLGGCIAG